MTGIVETAVTIIAADTAIGGPGRQALDRIMKGVTRLYDAKIDAMVQAIKDDADAKSVVTGSLAEATGIDVAATPTLRAKAANRWLSRAIREEEALEGIGRRAEQILLEKGEPTPEEAPSEEFLDRFERLASGATTEEAKTLFAKVLAGEIQKPGTYSLRALEFVNGMDQAVAAMITKGRSWGDALGRVPRTGSFTRGDGYALMEDLADLGLVRQVSYWIPPQPEGRHVVIYAGRLLWAHLPADQQFEFRCWAPTRLGEEIINLVPEDYSEEARATFLEALKALPGVEKVTTVVALPDHQWAEGETL